jgi:hypothetical protein
VVRQWCRGAFIRTSALCRMRARQRKMNGR